ncbi:hypothetical protein [Pseudoteredinibacter isoporae]|uniref:Uncharacterized protein n=1 Tax=Pseudoteredinibacter isoporae TaxID=570281 RepID=A0A7X0JUW0_9GAMM|nr:hypothetical protein [Pseudoteredinibacter isoporae]MBB6521751.1 hypothetical protein [Pseudoteredinibacter isoporae]NHO87299.1 hypothetical protein [Pseudoteredinibacter isoporae]NIB23069.1 hypothetical protein [Pseudoteredinibacter isoporae]
MSFEEELLVNLDAFIKTGEVYLEESSEAYFGRLAEVFPLGGSKISWDQVPNSIVETTNNKNDVAEWVNFFNAIIEKKGLSGKLVYINDSAIECALTMSIDILRKCIKQILEYPDHHYFIGENYAWCMTFTMEGDMTFGFKPE